DLGPRESARRRDCACVPCARSLSARAASELRDSSCCHPPRLTVDHGVARLRLPARWRCTFRGGSSMSSRAAAFPRAYDLSRSPNRKATAEQRRTTVTPHTRSAHDGPRHCTATPGNLEGRLRVTT